VPETPKKTPPEPSRRSENEPSKKYEFIEDIPGVGPATAEKLKEMGYHTVESLATATTKELETAGVGEKSAAHIIAIARGTIATSFIRASDLMKMREHILHLSTGCKELNKLIGGGLESQTITEFYGEYGVGKSILCHQLAVNAQLPIEKGGLNGGALYIDTENTFRPEWIARIAKSLKLNPEKTGENIIYSEAFNADHQMLILENADKVIQENKIKLIIVDSLTAHFRSEYLGREMLAERQQKLNSHLHRLARLSRAFNTTAVVTNQVMAKPDAFFASKVEAIGGHIVSHTTHTRIWIRKASGSLRIARLISSPYLPEGECTFKITDEGIEDVTEEDEAKKRT
jgi:DNA repair protein RadA